MAIGAQDVSTVLRPRARPGTWLVRAPRRDRLWLAFACLAAAGLAFAMWKGRGNSFFWDDWSWIEGRRTGLQAMLASYNQHVVIVPVAVYQLLLSTVGLSHYWIYRLLAALSHLTCAAAVFAYARRRLGAGALLLAAVVVFLGSGFDYILEPVAFGFTLSVAFSIAALLALDRDDRAGDLLACALLVLGFVFCEFAALFAPGIAIELTWRDRGLRRAWVWGAQLVVYAVWWLGYGGSTGAHGQLLAIPKFVVNMASSGAGGIFGLNLVDGRPVLVAVVGLVAWRILRRRAMTPRLAALMTTLASFWLLVAIARAGFGQPWASRYVYTSAILILLIVAESCSGVRLARPAAIGAVALGTLAVVGNIRAFDGGERYLHTGSQMVVAELGALQLARAEAPWTMPLDQTYGPQVIAGPYFAAADAVGSTDAASPRQLLRSAEPLRAAADAVLLRAGELQLTSLPAPRTAPLHAVGAPATGHVAPSAPPPPGECVEIRPQAPATAIDVPIAPGGVELTSATGSASQVWVRRFAADSGARPLTLPAGQALQLRPRPDRSAVPWKIRISAAQPIRACGL